jgi:ribose transport system ATP-binding protein
MPQTPILEFQDVRKHFGGVKAVDGVSFSIAPAEVHAIVGENGAGKTTLMNVVAGVYLPDAGRILMHGEPYSPNSPRDARARGISIVFQELALFPSLSVAANIFMGKEMMHRSGLDHKAMREQAQATLKRMGVELSVSELVTDLSVGQQQWVEIARALTDRAKVLILDEPNSALNVAETEALFESIRHLRGEGITVIYISHRLEEVFQIADRITVMRDGQYIGTWGTAQTNISEIVAAMVGRQVTKLFDREPAPLGDVVLEVDGLSLDGRVEPVSFRARAGEVVGLVGLAGAGIVDLFEVLFGIRRATGGQVLLGGQLIDTTSPLKAMEHQIAMMPSDRRGLGLMPNWSVLSNITLGVLSQLSRFGAVNHSRSKDLAHEYVRQLKIITESLDKGVLYLSGGNQQKVLLARWLATQPRVFILDDPTRGIDVGAKQEIYALIDRIAADGVAVLFTSSEMDEILALSDRILVLRKGRLIAELARGTWDKELVMEFVAGDLERGRAMLEARKEL